MHSFKTIGVVGVGAMGKGIVQIAAQAGLTVLIHDQQLSALHAAREALEKTWQVLVAKGKLTELAAAGALGRVHIAQTLSELADCDLVIEAIIERLDAKQALFQALEAVVSPQCVLVSNTSSLSITAIASACATPERVAGYHFFNPVPLMKVVEVIDGLRSDPAVGDALMSLTQTLGHTAVRAKDMPGFIVNHAGRGLGTEGLRTVQEGVTCFEGVDAIMREQCGFRMGPFELMDLTGVDVSHPVMESIYHQFYEEPRFRPSPITAQRVAGGLFGRKVGVGFYEYPDGKKRESPLTEIPTPDHLPPVWVSQTHVQGHAMAVQLFKALGVTIQTGSHPDAESLIVVTPYGQDISTAVSQQGLDATRTVGVDTFGTILPAKRRTLMVSPATTPKWRDAAHALLARDQVGVTVIQDSPGFVAQRVLATIVNVACEIAQQQIASPADIDRAVSLGLNYPAGPLALGDTLGAKQILEILTNMQAVTGDPRYRPSLWLQRRVQLGLSLLQPAATA
uniref:3-hydroxyacyl-CoA dehydrogenase n=1 Tax=Orrella sp. TaxID=1921583 RepID=UPI004048E3BC